MPKLLLVSANQFGYAAGYYYYAKYLSKYYNISFLCFDENKDKMKMEGINVIYINRINRYVDNAILLFNFLSLNTKNKYDVIILRYLPFSFIFKFLAFPRKFILDIRSATIYENTKRRVIGNIIIKFNSFFYNNVMILSNGLRNKLKIKRAVIIPLGGERKSFIPKNYTNIKLLYVGTLNNRNIEMTIEGFAKYKKEANESLNLSYDIVGNGSEANIYKLRSVIKKHNLEKYVKFHGYVNYERIAEFYEKNNIGVSFIPLKIFYENQPPTKTFEYLVSGLPVIATKIEEHISLITDKNGILISDNAEDFYNSLKKINSLKEKWVYKSIVEDGTQYEWKSIIFSKLLPYIRR